MGWLLDAFGWGVWGPSMIGFSVIGAMLMLTLWNARPRAHQQAPAAAAAPLPAVDGAPRTGTDG